MEKEEVSLISDEKFKKYVINRLVPFPLILEKAGYPGYSLEGKCFCPFHNNVNTPSAKLYKSNGSWSLFCFSEQKVYRPSDVIERKMISGASIYSIFLGIWKQLTQDDMKQLMEDYGKPVSYLPEGWEENKKVLNEFKNGKIKFSQYLFLLKKII